MEMESLNAGADATVGATKDEQGAKGMKQKLNLDIESKSLRMLRGAFRNKDRGRVPNRRATTDVAMNKREFKRGERRVAFDRDDDPHELYERFVANHALMFPTALREVIGGYKESCWSWFVLPCAPYLVDGVERGSATNRHYALRGDDAVVAYLECECVYTYSSRDRGIDRWVLEDEERPRTKLISLRDNYVAILVAIARQLESGNTLDNILGHMDAIKAVSSFELFHRIARDVTGDGELEGLCCRVLELSSGKRDSWHGPNRARTNSF